MAFKKLFFLVACTLFLNTKSQVLIKISNDSLISYSYNGGDEFNDAKLNTNYWKGPWTAINMAQDFRYNDENVKIENGLVNFLMLKKDSTYNIRLHEIDSSFLKEKKIKIENNNYKLGYSAGMIISREKVHYGIYELRFKVEEGKGVWPSFWFYGGNKNEEIDAFELKGEKGNSIHVDVHCPYGCDNGYKNKLGIKTNWGGWMPINEKMFNGFHIMLLEWNEEGVTWLFNGYPMAHFKGRFSNPMNLFLNTQIAANGRAFKPGPDKNTVFPNNFYVDYVRFWKKQTLANNILELKTCNNCDISNQFPSNYSVTAVEKKGLMYIKSEFKKEDGFVSLVLTNKSLLLVNAIGKISKDAISIIIKGEKKETVITDLSAENKIQLDPSDKQIELIIKTKQKTYQQKLIISK